MFPITSPQNERIRQTARLLTSRGRKTRQRFLVHGWREVERCVANLRGQVRELFLRSDASASEAAKRLVEQLPTQAAVFDVAPAAFGKIAYGDRDDGVVAVVARPELALDQLPLPSQGACLILERLEKPGNLGAIFRSSDGAGIDAVLIADPLTDLFHPNSIRASMGTVFSLPAAIGTAREIIEWCQQRSLKVCVARPDAGQTYTECDLVGGCAIALGNEAIGLSETWQAPSFTSLELPMAGVADSLNVSVTAAILAYEVRRQRAAN